MEISLQEVNSSVVSAVGYEDNTLVVQYKNSGLYQFFNVPPAIYDALMKADSIGRFLNQNVMDYFQHQRLK